MARCTRHFALAMIFDVGQASVFEPGNSLAPFRDNPDSFFKNWGNSTGNCAKSMTVSLYSLVEGQSRWTDFLYPIEAENNFQGDNFTQSTRGLWWMSYVAVALYLVLLWAGTAMMKDKQAFDLKGPLTLWNLFLAVYSFAGAVRTVPHLMLMLHSHGFQYTICRSAAVSYGCGASGLWVALFIYSKYFELIDTLFLVVRKKKVGFLHWYHHFTVLTYCWHSYAWEMPSGIYFIAMNYNVHSVMYFYYFLAAVCKRPPKWALAVTIMQLSQMVVGIYITVSHVIRLQSIPFCDGYMLNLKAAGVMYASYFYLFAEFLVKRYCLRSSKKKGE